MKNKIENLNSFFDSVKICGYWTKNPNAIDIKRNLEINYWYIIKKEQSEDYYNKYIGEIKITHNSDYDTFKIISIDKINKYEYILQLALEYGISGGTIPIITYGTIRLIFIEDNILSFELIDYDHKAGYYDYCFSNKEMLFYRAIKR